MLPTSKWQQILGELGSFNGHPPLGVNATCRVRDARDGTGRFQWAPTLGGECYDSVYGKRNRVANPFQWAPTLGGECYMASGILCRQGLHTRFNGHPPLGVNATS